MNSLPAKSPPPDQPQRNRALDPGRSILVQAPAGSGKTDLLTRRFLRLLAEVDEPGQVVAITFTNAAAVEMRHRILGELEKAAAVKGTGFSPYIDPAESGRASAPGGSSAVAGDEFTMDALAHRALDHSRRLGWKLLDLPAQLRISTIDSFCRDLALQQPLLSGLGGGLGIADQPNGLYRRAALQTLERIGQGDPRLSEAIEELLVWRDNNWQELEEMLVEMLARRDRWMHEFLLSHNPGWEALRQSLERPFGNAIREALGGLGGLLDQVPGAREEALELARFACTQTGGQHHSGLAELAEFPCAPFSSSDAMEDAREAHLALAQLLLIGDGAFRRQVDKRLGFPADRKREKAQILDLIGRLDAIPGLESALAAVRDLPSARYTEEEWEIVKACFTLLRHAAAQLKVVFAEAGAVDFVEVAQIAQSTLKGDDGLPSDAALAVADGVRHLLVDEFQDTSRRQHELLRRLIAAWPEREGRSCFVVGDPMQSIYFFREADAELFSRVKTVGLELQDEPLLFDFVPLAANFRAAPPLVEKLNEVFDRIFAAPDGSGVTFAPAQPAREDCAIPGPRFSLHLDFVPRTGRGRAAGSDPIHERESAHAAQIQQIVDLIQSHMSRVTEARERGEKYRLAVLARARKSLVPIAQALHQAGIPFRALDLEGLADRPEVLDALALARALLNPHDRLAWLGVLRAPWCGLSLEDLHRLTSGDDPELLSRPVPELLAERLPLLSEAGRAAAGRVLGVLNSVPVLRAAQPAQSLGTWLQQLWLCLGGDDCVDCTARANLDLLWSCLDGLPAGEQDLLGPALDAALERLTALPDPAANSDCGVQLMTIHKSKGLEFEVVVMPDLQAASGRGVRNMLSWLERGLESPDDSGEVSEFLIAPFQPKGADRGKAKEWVDRVYRQREAQEDRRVLYVAATRAREELHLFARPACKLEADGSLILPDPAASLLATAWPALEGEVRARFDAWKSAREASAAGQQQVLDSIAASEESNLLRMPSPPKPTILRRLPPDYRLEQFDDFQPAKVESPAPPQMLRGQMLRGQMLRAPSSPRLFAERVGNHQSQAGISSAGAASSSLYARHQGGLLSRALGTAVHEFLEELSRLRAGSDWSSARAALPQFEPRISAQARAYGLDQARAAHIASQALNLVLNASLDPIAQWILSPHPEAASELRWTGIVGGSLHEVRVDRVFRAGLNPQSEGQAAWWIVDYKTAHADNLAPAAALPELRRIFAPQLEAYAQILRHLHGQEAVIRAGLYYPRMLLLDWWEMLPY